MERISPKSIKVHLGEGDSHGTWSSIDRLAQHGSATSQGFEWRQNGGKNGNVGFHVSADVPGACSLSARDFGVHLDTAGVEQGWIAARTPESDM